MAAQITGADKVLEWTDLPTGILTAPGEDDEADAAFTNAIFRFTQQPKISWVAGTKPDKYQIEDNFNMVVELITSGGGASWKASWVDSRPPAERQRLLTHERGHYSLVALLGRDCFNDLKTLLTHQYDSVKEAQSAIDTVIKPYSSKTQPIQDVYDSDQQTRHGFNTQTQIVWNGHIATAGNKGTPILSVLKGAGISV